MEANLRGVDWAEITAHYDAHHQNSRVLLSAAQLEQVQTG